MLLVRRKWLPTLLFFPSFTAHRTHQLPPSHIHPLLRCLSASATQDPPPKTQFMLDYLITSCGFSPDEAAKVSNRIADVKSTGNPDSVVHFLKLQGFSSTGIRTLISWHPKLLFASVEKTLKPNLTALRDVGLSSSGLSQLVLSDARSLILRAAVPRIQFWRAFLEGDEKTFLKVFKRNRGLVAHDIGRGISPKISLLLRHGLSIRRIGMILQTVPWFITSSICSIELLLKRTNELGFRVQSGMFIQGLFAVTSSDRKTLEKKMALFVSFGWSEEVFHSAFCRAPGITRISDKTIRKKMDFLVKKAGCDPRSYIASRPEILLYSLEKMLMPRNYILQILKSKRVVGEKVSLVSMIKISNRKFVERYIVPHKEKIPGIHEDYVAACAGRIPTLMGEEENEGASGTGYLHDV